MFVDGGWKPAWEPPLHREPRFTKRQEGVLLGVVAINMLLLVVAPIGGATLIQAAIALLR